MAFFFLFFKKHTQKKTGEKQLPHVFFMLKKKFFQRIFFLNVNL